jgi:hypothetical protein
MSEERGISKCTRADLQVLLGRYEFDTLGVQERHAVEAHVLECDVCFAELERGAGAVASMREHATELTRALNKTIRVRTPPTKAPPSP